MVRRRKRKGSNSKFNISIAAVAFGLGEMSKYGIFGAAGDLMDGNFRQAGENIADNFTVSNIADTVVKGALIGIGSKLAGSKGTVLTTKKFRIKVL